MSAHALIEAQLETMRRALGPALLSALSDPDLSELYSNPDGTIWLDTRRRGRVRTELTLSREQAESFLQAVAHYTRTPFDADHPSLQADLPEQVFGRARLQAFAPPVTARPCFNLRRLTSSRLSLEDDYLAVGTMSEGQAEVLREALRNRLNVLVIGGTRSGKTLLAGALLAELSRLCPTDRLVVIEDTPELPLTALDHLALRTSPEVSMAELVRMTLRASPDRIVVGEVRDHAALALLDAWSTGHPGGISTFHADSPVGALSRLVRLASRADLPPDPDLVGDAVDLLVHIVGGPMRRRIAGLVRVHRFDPASGFVLEHLETLS